MAGRLTDRTLVVHPVTGEAMQLAVGDEVPAWAEVGDHLLEQEHGAQPAAKTTRKK